MSPLILKILYHVNQRKISKCNVLNFKKSFCVNECTVNTLYGVYTSKGLKNLFHLESLRKRDIYIYIIYIYIYNVYI